MDVDLDEVLREVADRARPHAAEGEIPPSTEALEHVDPDSFGLALVEMDGTDHVIGDADEPFAIQSISKVFSLVLAMQVADEAEGVAKELWERVGVEPTGDPYNSLIQLERHQGVPRNPMINAGALIVDDVLLDHREDPSEAMLELVSDLAGEKVEIDQIVRDGEVETSARNRAIASLMESFGNLTHDVEEVLDSYGRQCAAAMTARQLARAVRFLGNNGVDPASGRRILHPELARRATAIMLTCGTYDAAGGGQLVADVGGQLGELVADVVQQQRSRFDQGAAVLQHRFELGHQRVVDLQCLHRPKRRLGQQRTRGGDGIDGVGLGQPAGPPPLGRRPLWGHLTSSGERPRTVKGGTCTTTRPVLDRCDGARGGTVHGRHRPPRSL